MPLCLASSLAIFLLIGGRAERATAAFITYTETAVGQGTLGQHAFNSLVTLSLTADTAAITMSQGGVYHYSARVTTATVSVDGLTATFVDPVFVVSGKGIAGFTDVTQPSTPGQTILDVSNPVFTGYDLSTPLGPIAGSPGGFGGPDPTTLGNFSFSPSFFANGTFTATAALPVPEPSSLVLCGIAGVIGFRVGRGRASARAGPGV